MFCRDVDQFEGGSLSRLGMNGIVQLLVGRNKSIALS